MKQHFCINSIVLTLFVGFFAFNTNAQTTSFTQSVSASGSYQVMVSVGERTEVTQVVVAR